MSSDFRRNVGICYNQTSVMLLDDAEQGMDILVALLKYTFVVALGVEIVVIARAVALLALEKARPEVTVVHLAEQEE